ncbi:MAG: sialidase family protein, partial [Lentisphaerota bacterium]
GDSIHEGIGLIDHYCGLGVSLSKDNGYTWTNINVLYEYGRMQPSMVLMPNGDVVMTYAVRMGCLQEEYRLVDDDGYPQWSIEAIVSRDNGETWDLAHKYILAKWSGSSQAQSTCTVLLPDGSLFTAFGSGYLSLPIQEVQRQEKYPIGLLPREVCLVRWRPEE